MQLDEPSSSDEDIGVSAQIARYPIDSGRKLVELSVSRVWYATMHLFVHIRRDREGWKIEGAGIWISHDSGEIDEQAYLVLPWCSSASGTLRLEGDAKSDVMRLVFDVRSGPNPSGVMEMAKGAALIQEDTPGAIPWAATRFLRDAMLIDVACAHPEYSPRMAALEKEDAETESLLEKRTSDVAAVRTANDVAIRAKAFQKAEAILRCHGGNPEETYEIYTDKAGRARRYVTLLDGKSSKIVTTYDYDAKGRLRSIEAKSHDGKTDEAAIDQKLFDGNAFEFLQVHSAGYRSVDLRERLDPYADIAKRRDGTTPDGRACRDPSRQ